MKDETLVRGFDFIVQSGPVKGERLVSGPSILAIIK